MIGFSGLWESLSGKCVAVGLQPMQQLVSVLPSLDLSAGSLKCLPIFLVWQLLITWPKMYMFDNQHAQLLFR